MRLAGNDDDDDVVVVQSSDNSEIEIKAHFTTVSKIFGTFSEIIYACRHPRRRFHYRVTVLGTCR